MATRKSGKTKVRAKRDARRDTLDFRDLMYAPALVEVPAYRKLTDYQKAKVPILDQGRQGACTGYGLATVVHYLLRTHKVVPDTTVVSPHMLYDLARRYDEYPGFMKDEGSSCRGAMKGWYKHGVCAGKLWPTARPGAPLDHGTVLDAASRPLGAYFRVNHRSLVAMHSAITEAGIIFASCTTHGGWDEVGADGIVPAEGAEDLGHAFAIVAYDDEGFWFQNSWGRDWGKQGFGRIFYDDWLKHGTDAWVARLGVPVKLKSIDGATKPMLAGVVRARSWSYADLRPHVVNIGDHGLLDPHGDVGTTPQMVREIIRGDMPRIMRSWAKKRVVLYAHGGLVKQDDALQRVDEYRRAMIEKECYPLAFVWNSDFWTTVKELLQNAVAQRRTEGFISDAKDFMLDRLDDALEPLARRVGGRAVWSKMKSNAIGATVEPEGGARLVAQELALLARNDPSVEIHVVGHSAGSIFHAPLVQLLASKGVIAQGPMKGERGLGIPVKTCTLWAPAATNALFRESYLPLVTSSRIGRLALFHLSDPIEQDDDCAGIYHKSLLYLVSNALDDRFHVPLFHPGEPIVGLQNCIDGDAVVAQLFASGAADRVIAPTPQLPQGDPNASQARHHGDFDDDKPTLYATLARILGSAADAATAEIVIKTGAGHKRDIRRAIDRMPDFALTR